MLPPDLRDKVDQTLLYAPNFQVRAELKRSVDLLNAAATDRKFIEFGYTREDGQESHRRVRPLGLYFWGGVWTLASWCEMRKDFRNFRVDRMTELRALEQQFPVDPKKSLHAFSPRCGRTHLLSLKLHDHNPTAGCEISEFLLHLDLCLSSTRELAISAHSWSSDMRA